uniref:Uncharacterized protein n=1 Tax=Panagrolaimus sp. JU765 TaxID=591449 RepID=A0AC34QTR8_9BILA
MRLDGSNAKPGSHEGLAFPVINEYDLVYFKHLCQKRHKIIANDSLLSINCRIYVTGEIIECDSVVDYGPTEYKDRMEKTGQNGDYVILDGGDEGIVSTSQLLPFQVHRLRKEVCDIHFAKFMNLIQCYRHSHWGR